MIRMKELITRFSGFSAVGVVITILSAFLIYFFLKILQTPLFITYTLVYIFSICISFYLNAKFIFKVESNKENIAKYFLVYGSGMLLGLVTLRIYKMTIPLDNWMLAYLVIPVTLSWNFIMLTMFLKKD